MLRGEELRPLVRVRPRRYSLDEHYFDQIDSEQKAYWLGFITADGCIANSRKSLTINLKVADAGHLEKLGAALSSDYPVRPSGSGKPSEGIVRWAAFSATLVQALGTHGVTPQKSATAEAWDGPPDLLRHYWRGMVDGDGGIGRFRGRRSSTAIQWSVHLVGSRACVEAFAQWASGICGSHAQPKPYKHSMNCWHWLVGGNRMAPRVVRELYRECAVSLDRKQALADAVLAMTD